MATLDQDDLDAIQALIVANNSDISSQKKTVYSQGLLLVKAAANKD